ncbi:hypothetical protein AB1Y20_001565 [Prymnesium parvum]|uniref:Uncharacterized protein n=1 Tax=Prymnesium parvum TaxID=97485 RepID=A0AB34KE07_PRYPA
MVGTRGVRRTQAADAEHHEAANDRVAVGRPQAAKIVGRQAKRTGGVARAPSQESIPQVAEDAHRSEAGASAAVTAGDDQPCETIHHGEVPEDALRSEASTSAAVTAGDDQSCDVMHHGAVPDDLGQLLESESDMAQHSSNVLDAEDDVVGPASPIALSEASQSVEDMLEELAQGMLHGAEEDVEVDDACVQQRLDAAMKEYAVSIATLKKAYPTANIFIKHLEGIGFATDGLILDTENGEIMSSEVVLSRLISEEDPAWMSMMPQQTKSAAKRLAQACVLEGGAELADAQDEMGPVCQALSW